MFIVWGKKIVRQKLGFVADFCPVCLDITTSKVERVGSASHVYYLSFGDGELVGYERTCEGCHLAFETVPDTYSGMAKRSAPATDLIAETFPNIHRHYHTELEFERTVRNHPSQLSREQRTQRLRTPFVMLAPSVQQKLASTQMDGKVWLAVAAFLPIVWVFAAIADFFKSPEGEFPVGLMLAGVAVAVGVVIWQVHESARRYVLRHSLPALSQALAPLRPTDAEIESVLEELRRHKLKLGNKLTTADIMGAMPA